MNFCFTISRHGEGLPLSKICAGDYQRIWNLFAEQHFVILYKFKHLYNDAGKPHVHFHGCFFSPSSKIDYKPFNEINKIFSFKVEKEPVNFERWHEYCMHEMKTKLELSTKDETTYKSVDDFLEKFTEKARPLKQQKIIITKKHDLFKLEISGGI